MAGQHKNPHKSGQAALLFPGHCAANWVGVFVSKAKLHTAVPGSLATQKFCDYVIAERPSPLLGKVATSALENESVSISLVRINGAASFGDSDSSGVFFP